MGLSRGQGWVGAPGGRLHNCHTDIVMFPRRPDHAQQFPPTSLTKQKQKQALGDVSSNAALLTIETADNLLDSIDNIAMNVVVDKPLAQVWSSLNCR